MSIAPGQGPDGPIKKSEIKTEVVAPREQKEAKLRRGAAVGDYIYIKKISGGKSDSWLGHHKDKPEEQLFIKRFNAPKYPLDAERLIDEKRYNLAIEACKSFEVIQETIMAKLRSELVGSGSLLQAVNFDRDESTYFKVYPFVKDVQTFAETDVRFWGNKQRVLFVRTLLLALSELHRRDVVHSDIKSANILVIRKPAGLVAKLIDFDDAYVSGNPPPVDQLGGDIFSPEMLVYEENDEEVLAKELTCASDLFSLAFVLHQKFSPKSQSPRWSDGEHSDDPGKKALLGLKAEFEDLGLGMPLLQSRIQQCLNLNPRERPTTLSLLSASQMEFFGDDI